MKIVVLFVLLVSISKTKVISYFQKQVPVVDIDQHRTYILAS